MYLNPLSSRFNAPSRSPLRRVGCTRASIPFKRKSPTNDGSETPLFEAEDLDTISLRAQAELCHEVLHLSPALQRFWNVSKTNLEGLTGLFHYKTHLLTAVWDIFTSITTSQSLCTTTKRH